MLKEEFWILVRRNIKNDDVEKMVMDDLSDVERFTSKEAAIFHNEYNEKDEVPKKIKLSIEVSE